MKNITPNLKEERKPSQNLSQNIAHFFQGKIQDGQPLTDEVEKNEEEEPEGNHLGVSHLTNETKHLRRKSMISQISMKIKGQNDKISK